MVAGKIKLHAKLVTLGYSKLKLWNEKVAKVAKNQTKILDPSTSQKIRVSSFWLQKSQSGNPGLLCYANAEMIG